MKYIYMVKKRAVFLIVVFAVAVIGARWHPGVRLCFPVLIHFEKKQRK